MAVPKPQFFKKNLALKRAHICGLNVCPLKHYGFHHLKGWKKETDPMPIKLS